jgi:hypothetical protein
MSQKYPGGLITKTPVVPSGPYETSTASGVWTLDQQAYWRKLNQWPIAGSVQPDPQFNYVTMLLHGDGTNGAQNNTFLDSSASPLTITRNGNTTQGSFSPYGSNWSNYFDGSTDYFSVANNTALQFGTGDFTIESWVYLNAFATGVAAVLSKRSGSAEDTTWAIDFAANTGDLRYRILNSTGGVITVSIGTVSLGTWTHIAVSKQSGTTRTYLNGVAGGTTTNSTSIDGSTNDLRIGTGDPSSATIINGYISNARLVKGTAVYTAAFTPPTTPLTAISGTSLLTCQSNRFIDNSASPLTITVTGTPSVQRFNPFGTATAYSTSVIGGSGYFDGTGDTLTCTGTLPATGDFTLSLWAYPTSLAGYAVAIQQAGSGNTFYLYLGYADGMIDIQVGSTNYSDYTTGVYKAGQWNYVQVVKSSSSYSVYVNGTALSVISSTGNIGTTSIASGTLTLNYNTNCYITDVRIVNTALGNSVPTAPLTAVSGTTMLLSMQNGAIFDNAMINNLETAGNAQISTSVVKYGTGSLKFDGLDDYLAIRNTRTSTPYGTGSWTIEGWIYPLSAGSFSAIYVNGYPIQIWQFGFNIEIYISRANSADYLVNQLTGPTSSLSSNTWSHFAIVRNGTAFRVYINGVGGSTTTSADAIAFPSNANATIADAPVFDPSTYGLSGYIDEFRITQGYARYTANFTPPTAAFANIGPT